jgi:hypothetical protein
MKEKIAGTKAVAERMAATERRFIDFVMEKGFTREQANTIMTVYTKVKAVKFDYVGGQFSLTHGDFAEADVMTRALSYKD